VTISQWQWEKSERLDSALEVLHGIHEHRGKQLFDLTTTTTVARRSSTLGSHPPLGRASPIKMKSPRSMRGEAAEKTDTQRGEEKS
jgi:hypothetical protein